MMAIDGPAERHNMTRIPSLSIPWFDGDKITKNRSITFWRAGALYLDLLR